MCFLMIFVNFLLSLSQGDHIGTVTTALPTLLTTLFCSPTVSLPAELQRWFTPAGYPLLSASCCWGFSSFSSLPPHVSSTSPVNSTAHLLPPTSAHLSCLYLFRLLLILFSFRFLRIQKKKKKICSLFDMEACLRLSVYSGGPVFPGTLHQKSLWLDWFS